MCICVRMHMYAFCSYEPSCQFYKKKKKAERSCNKVHYNTTVYRHAKFSMVTDYKQDSKFYMKTFLSITKQKCELLMLCLTTFRYWMSTMSEILQKDWH